MTRAEQADSLLKEHATVAGGADELAIRIAEEHLNVRFPPSYRSFLSKYGASFCTDADIAGLFPLDDPDQTPQWSHVVTTNQQLHKAARGNLPKDYVYISDDGGDFYYYLDTGRCNAQGECPVIVLGPGADAIVIAEDFYDFVIRSFNRTLSF